MIEAKYGMKYHFPHTIIHIVDRSGYTGEIPVVYADDPSVFATMVVSGFPMGEDGKMINAIKIPGDKKVLIRKQLAQIGITEGFVYPEIEHRSNTLLSSLF